MVVLTRSRYVLKAFLFNYKVQVVQIVQVDSGCPSVAFHLSNGAGVPQIRGRVFCLARRRSGVPEKAWPVDLQVPELPVDT